MEVGALVAILITLCIAVALVPRILEALVGINKVVGVQATLTTSSSISTIPDIPNPNTQLILLVIILGILLILSLGIILYRKSSKQDPRTFL